MTAFFVFVDDGRKPLEIRLFAHHFLVLPGKQHLGIGILRQDFGQRCQQDFDALLGREAGCHADDRTALRHPMRGCKSLDGPLPRRRQNHGRQDRRQLVFVIRKEGRMIGVVLRVRHNMIGKQGCGAILHMHHGVDNAVEKSGRQQQVTVIRQDRQLAQQTCAISKTGRVELRQMHLHHIVSGYVLPGQRAQSRHEHAFADPQRHRCAEDMYTVARFLRRRRRVEVGGQHGHFVAARGKSLGQPFGVNGQARCMGAIVGQDS